MKTESNAKFVPKIKPKTLIPKNKIPAFAKLSKAMKALKYSISSPKFISNDTVQGISNKSSKSLYNLSNIGMSLKSFRKKHSAITSRKQIPIYDGLVCESCKLPLLCDFNLLPRRKVQGSLSTRKLSLKSSLIPQERVRIRQKNPSCLKRSIYIATAIYDINASINPSGNSSRCELMPIYK